MSAWSVYQSSDVKDILTYRIEGLPIRDSNDIDLDLSKDGYRLHVSFDERDESVEIKFPISVVASELSCRLNQCMGSFSISIPLDSEEEEEEGVKEVEEQEPDKEGEGTSCGSQNSDEVLWTARTPVCICHPLTVPLQDDDYAKIGLLAPKVAQGTRHMNLKINHMPSSFHIKNPEFRRLVV